MTALSAGQAAWLLIRLRLRRAINLIAESGRKSPGLGIVMVIIGPVMLVTFTAMSYQAIGNLETELGTVLRVGSDRPNSSPSRAGGPDGEIRYGARIPIGRQPGSTLPSGVLRGAAFLASLAFLSVVVLVAVGRDLARPEWDLEWLATLPMPMTALLAARLVERAVTSASGFFFLMPFLSVLAWACGYRASALLVGLGFGLALMLLVSIVQMLLDTGLRLWLAPPKLRNLQAVLSIISVPLPLLATSATVAENTPLFRIAGATPDWALWLPPGLAVQAIAAADIATALKYAGLLGAEIAIGVVAGMTLLRWLLRHGVVAAGAREAVARAPRLQRPIRRRQPWLGPVLRREMRLLARDRNYMVQALLFPALIIGSQFALSAGARSSLSILEQPKLVGLFAFMMMSYSLMFSALQALNTEGPALWILYGVPRPLEAVLWQKAVFWAAVASFYPVAMFAGAVSVTGTATWQLLGMLLVVLAGVPIFSVIAIALGVFACDPLSPEPQRRLRMTYSYIYLLLASLFAFAIYVDDLWQRAVIAVLTALAAVALWQKAHDRLPYLLDPASSPPSRVSLADGLIAALLFFVLQGFILGFVKAVTGKPALLGEMLMAYFVAGALTYGLARLIYAYTEPIDVPRVLGGSPRMLLGIAAGTATALAAALYLWLVPRLGFLLPPPPIAKLPDLFLAAGLAVVAAPVFEEFIFRGLIFGGLRRSFGLAGATLASAAIFAMVHPPHSAIPVFVLGLATALVYERTRVLIAPMLVHAVYNAGVIALQWHAM